MLSLIRSNKGSNTSHKWTLLRKGSILIRVHKCHAIPAVGFRAWIMAQSGFRVYKYHAVHVVGFRTPHPIAYTRLGGLGSQWNYMVIRMFKTSSVPDFPQIHTP